MQNLLELILQSNLIDYTAHACSDLSAIFFNTKLLFGEHLIEYIDLKLTATKIAVISEIYKLYAVVFFLLSMKNIFL